MAVSASVDLRGQFGPVRNQGKRPTCMAFAASDAHAALRDGWYPLSCEYIFYKAQRRAGRAPASGALLSATLGALHDDGQPEESGWPYLPNTPDDAGWAPPASIGPVFGRNGATAKHAVDHIAAQLDQGVPVIILTRLSISFFTPSAGAMVIPGPGEIPDPNIRHALVAVGHGKLGADRFILVRNSWGNGWGDQGYAWVSEGFLLQGLYAAATLMENVDVSANSVAA